METTTEIKLLNIGDTVYQYGNYGIYEKATVESTTPKRATLSNGHVVRRELIFNGNYITNRISMPDWERGLNHYRLENETLKQEWFRKDAIQKLNDFGFSKLDNVKLAAILAIVEEKTP
jgi:hypothetical protein